METILLCFYLLLVAIGFVSSGVRRTCGPEHCHKALSFSISQHIYQNFLQQPTIRRLDYICRAYTKWDVCVSGVHGNAWHDDTRCPHDQQELARRRVLAVCTHSKHEVAATLTCLGGQTQLVNPLFRACYRTMEMKKHHQLTDSCTAVRDYAQCEDGLVRSACGSDMADLVQALSLHLNLPLLTSQPSCQLTAPSDTPVFYYTFWCPPDFPLRMRTCYDEHIRPHSEFTRPWLPAIIKASHSQLHTWCGGYEAYMKCMGRLGEQCSEGLKAVYKAEGDWAATIIMAGYMCQRHVITGLRSYSSCLEPLWSEAGSMSLCNSVQQGIPSQWMISRMVCGQQVDRKIARLSECYTAVLTRHCGTAARRLVTPMVNIQIGADNRSACGNHQVPLQSVDPDSPRAAQALGSSASGLYEGLCETLLAVAYVLLIR